MAGLVTLSISDNIGIIEFYHPKGYSLPGELLNKLVDTFHQASNHPDITVIVLKSSGKGAFCAGASFDELIQIEDPESGHQFFSGFAHLILAMIKCPKLIVTQVQGKVVGGGVGIVAASDYVIASKEASIKLSELTLGIGPFVIAPVIEHKIGVSALASLSINATDWKNAIWAIEKGLYHQVVDSQTELENAVSKLASSLSAYNPEAMKELKRVLWEKLVDIEKLLTDRAKISGNLAQSDFTKRFIEQFKG